MELSGPDNAVRVTGLFVPALAGLEPPATVSAFIGGLTQEFAIATEVTPVRYQQGRGDTPAFVVEAFLPPGTFPPATLSVTAADYSLSRMEQ